MLIAQQADGPLIRFTLDPLFEDTGFALAIMGILVVFMALALVIAFITVLPHLARRATAQPAPTDVKPVASDELPAETVIVIAAAVAETIRQPHRIVKIRGLTPEDLGWSFTGRLQHHQSHQVRGRTRR